MAVPEMNKLSEEDLDLILANTTSLWGEMRRERIFLTGGTGFFGCWLLESFCHVNRLLDLGAEAVVLTRNPDAFAQKCPHLTSDRSVSLQAGDVRTFAWPKGEFRFLIHAATEASARQASEAPLEMLSTIVGGTERTLQCAGSRGVRKFLLTSSGAIYGKQPPEMTHVPESYSGAPDPLDPQSVYGEGKRAAELLCSLVAKSTQMECKIARCWAFCGPHLPLDRHFAIGNFIGDVLHGRPIRISGDGTPRRSYQYAADLTVWLWTLLFNGPSLMPFNVGSEHDVSILDLARTVVATLAPETEILVAQKAAPGALPARYVPSIDRARDQLGLSEIVGLEESIRRTAAWHRRHQ
jgi:nucleoside-diphosphate-sugar epimerase